MMVQFEEIEPECQATVNVTSFRFQGKIYTVSTTDITHLRRVQKMYDVRSGYVGKLGFYETMLFVNQKSMVYPFGDLPRHAGLGVFQRYDTEEEARDGHQEFVTRVKRIVSSMA